MACLFYVMGYLPWPSISSISTPREHRNIEQLSTRQRSDLGPIKTFHRKFMLIPNSQNIETMSWQVPAINQFGRTWQVGNSPNLAPRTTLHAVADKMPLQTHFLLHLFLLSLAVAQFQGSSGDNEELPGLPPVLEEVDNSCALTHECIPKVEWANNNVWMLCTSSLEKS